MIPGNANPLLLASAAADAAAAGPTRSLRFNDGDSAYLGKTFSSSSNQKTWTWSAWVKRSTFGITARLFDAYTSQTDTGYTLMGFNTSDQLFITGWNTVWKVTSQVFRDPGAFFHLVVAFDVTESTGSDRIKFYVNGTQITNFSTNASPAQNTNHAVNGAFAHAIGRYSPGASQYFDGYMTDIYFIDGSALDPTSFGAYDDNGVWQAATYSGTFGTNGFHLLDFANEATVGHDSSGNENDFTAYNLVAGVGKVFTTAKIYSVYAAATVSSNYSVQYSDDNSNWTTAFSGVISNNGAFGLQSGTNPGDGSYGLRKYWRYVTGSVVSTHHPRCSRIVLSDGVSDVNIQVFTSDNTSDTGTIPAEGDTYTYTDTTAAADVDVLFDVPTNGTQSDTGAGGEVSGNYATLNPLDVLKESGNTTSTLSNGNLDVAFSSGTNAGNQHHSTIGVSSGKYYVEWTDNSSSPSSNSQAFIAGVQDTATQGNFLSQAGGYGISTGSVRQLWLNGSNTNTWWSGTPAQGDVYAIALDCDNNTIAFYRNGSSLGSAQSIPSGKTYVFAITVYQWQASPSVSVNFGARSFAYSAPSGYKALCTTNLPTPTIADGSDQFEAVTIDNASATGSITGLSFAPDFAWFKRRDSAANHFLLDTIRGDGVLFSDLTNAENAGGTDYIDWNSDGIGYKNGLVDAGANNIVWLWNASANSNKTYTVKVVSDGGNKYRFDDFGTSAVTLDLAEGSTYVFDQSDSSNSGHPLRFSTTSDGTHGSGSEYTTGVTATGTPGSAGAKTTIVIPAGTTYSDDLTATSSGAYFASGAGAADAFDGNLNNSAQSEPNGSTITFSPTGGITVSTSLRVYRGSDSTSNTVNVSVNGGSAVTFARGSWVDLSFTGTLTSLAVSSPSANPGLSAIEVDGVVLEDNNSTPTLYYYCSSHSGMGGQANTNSTAGASNFDGNIQSTVKANPEAGFSIVSYTGNNGSSGTVGHGLNAKPGMFIVKNRDTTGDDWVVYHEALGATKRLDLNGTGGPSTNTSQFNDTEPTSSVFTVGSFQNINDNYDYIAYCISPVAGHSAVGQYTGNGSSSGPFVHTGFRVAFILIRRSNSGGAWVIVDNKRDGYNETYKWLEPNTTTAEQSVTPVANVDFLSNGFKLRGNGATTNASGGEYIYWAIAENPFSSNGGLAR